MHKADENSEDPLGCYLNILCSGHPGSNPASQKVNKICLKNPMHRGEEPIILL